MIAAAAAQVGSPQPPPPSPGALCVPSCPPSLAPPPTPHSELSSEETHSLFGEFVEAWNGKKLSEDYYAGNLASTGVARTSYKWGFSERGASAAERLEQQQDE